MNLPSGPERRLWLRVAGATALLFASCAANAQGQAHVHGKAKLDIAVETTKLTILLDSPLDSLLGFERAPRTPAERKQADAMVARLSAADAMFRIDPAAQCKPGRADLTSSALKLGTAEPARADDGHAGIEAAFEFNCVDARKASFVDVGLFEFPRMQRLDVQVAGSGRQFKRELKRPAARIVLAK